MERPIQNHPFPSLDQKIPALKKDDGEDMNEHIRKFIEELEKGNTPQEAALHAQDFRNTLRNYLLEKWRHRNYWTSH